MFKFLKDKLRQWTEKISGKAGEMMGPFRKGQIANLPSQIAQILIDDNRAEKVEE